VVEKKIREKRSVESTPRREALGRGTPQRFSCSSMAEKEILGDGKRHVSGEKRSKKGGKDRKAGKRKMAWIRKGR